jgi:hypothetical protein
MLFFFDQHVTALKTAAAAPCKRAPVQAKFGIENMVALLPSSRL